MEEFVSPFTGIKFHADFGHWRNKMICRTEWVGDLSESSTAVVAGEVVDAQTHINIKLSEQTECKLRHL